VSVIFVPLLLLKFRNAPAKHPGSGPLLFFINHLTLPVKIVSGYYSLPPAGGFPSVFLRQYFSMPAGGLISAAFLCLSVRQHAPQIITVLSLFNLYNDFLSLPIMLYYKHSTVFSLCKSSIVTEKYAVCIGYFIR